MMRWWLGTGAVISALVCNVARAECPDREPCIAILSLVVELSEAAPECVSATVTEDDGCYCDAEFVLQNGCDVELAVGYAGQSMSLFEVAPGEIRAVTVGGADSELPVVIEDDGETVLAVRGDGEAFELSLTGDIISTYNGGGWGVCSASPRSSAAPGLLALSLAAAVVVLRRRRATRAALQAR